METQNQTGAPMTPRDSSGKVIWVLITLVIIFVLGAIGFVVYKFVLTDQDQGLESSADTLYDEVDAKKAKGLIETKTDIIVLDVSDSYKAGHIPGAVNIEFPDLATNLGSLDKSMPVLVYSNIQLTSVDAAKILIENGFTEVYRLKGEFKAWTDAGNNVEEGEGIYLTEDTDGDGLTDIEEKELGSDPMKADTDDDGLGDLQEVKLKTEVSNPDTDGDGFTDGEEIDGGFDPLKKPDEDQEIVKVDQQIELEDLLIIGIEGDAIRYQRDGKFFLEVNALLPKLEEGTNYVVWGEDVEKKLFDFGIISAESSRIDEDTEIEMGEYRLKFDSADDLYQYFDISVGTKDKDYYDALLNGEFSQESID